LPTARSFRFQPALRDAVASGQLRLRHDGVMRSLEFSLERLGLDHIDIVYVTMSMSSPTAAGKPRTPAFANSMDGGYKALGEIARRGAIQAIGAGVKEWGGRRDVGAKPAVSTVSARRPLPRCSRKKLHRPAVLPRQEDRRGDCGPFNSAFSAPDRSAAPLRLPAAVARCSKRVSVASNDLQGPRRQARRGRAALSAQPSGDRQRHPAAKNRAKCVATLRCSTPRSAAMWRTLKAEGLLRPDAPTPR